jgi:hypothetical protein
MTNGRHGRAGYRSGHDSAKSAVARQPPKLSAQQYRAEHPDDAGAEQFRCQLTLL